MENINQHINENVINNIYSSYGPLVGKACENTNKIFYNDINCMSPKQEIKLSEHALEINNQTNIIQNAGSIPLIDEKPIETVISSSGYNIFGYTFSLWTLILLIIVISCVVYFIYKYFFTKNELVTYKKIDNQINQDNQNAKNKKNTSTNLETENNSNSLNSSNSSSSYDTYSISNLSKSDSSLNK